MYKHILIPLDGSDLAEQAVTEARKLIGPETTITLFQVIRLPLPVMSPDVGLSMPVIEMDDLMNEAMAYLNKVAAELATEGIEAKCEVVEADNVADAITDFARGHSVDLIIKTTHGRGGLSRLVFGSVAEGVVRHAPCPVLLIRAALVHS
ncbi:MAG: universal stress protein [Caldilineales bacterium]|nr:universal stress protein [Caldilineales bacterium]MCW5858458.1 universal stress protein [Caldilineales bacterium]